MLADFDSDSFQQRVLGKAESPDKSPASVSDYSAFVDLFDLGWYRKDAIPSDEMDEDLLPVLKEKYSFFGYSSKFWHSNFAAGATLRPPELQKRAVALSACTTLRGKNFDPTGGSRS